jgi:hypothetical protein
MMMKEVHIFLEGLLEVFFIDLLLFEKRFHFFGDILFVLIHKIADLIIKGPIFEIKELQTGLEISC